MEAVDLRGYDLVVSSSSAWAHGVIPDEDATHVCYCHNPFRYAWNDRERALSPQSRLHPQHDRPTRHHDHRRPDERGNAQQAQGGQGVGQGEDAVDVYVDGVLL